MKPLTVFCTVITLCTGIQLLGAQKTTICNSPQYLKLGKTGIITCRFEKEFFAVWWYKSIDFERSHPTIQYQNRNKYGPGYESLEFDVSPNGSLIIHEVMLQHEDVFTVAYLPSEEDVHFFKVRVIVTEKPAVPFPIIAQCGNITRTCFTTLANEAEVKCIVYGARPEVSLEFIATTVKGDKILPSNLTIVSDGEGFTSTVIARNVFNYSSRLVLLSCKASSIPGTFVHTKSFVLVQNDNAYLVPEKIVSVTVERFERTELPCSENINAFNVWKKAIPPKYSDYKLLAYSVNVKQEFVEVFAEDFTTTHNVSLVILSTDFKHEGKYVCIYGDGLNDGFKVYKVTVAGNISSTQISQPFLRGALVYALVICLVLLILIFLISIVIFSMKRFQWRRATQDSVEGIPLCTASSEAKLEFVKQLKQTYAGFYSNVKPIPYSKDKMYCVKDVFIDQCIARKRGMEWIDLETYRDVFSDTRIQSKRLILEGDPGYGKTILTLQYAYEWSQSICGSPLKDVEIFILLRLGQMGNVPTIYTAIKQFLLPNTSTLSESDIESILHNASSVVMIFDEYDEYPDKDNISRDVMRIIANEIFQNSKVLLTTRSSCLPKCCSPKTKRLKITGFDHEARINYITKAVPDTEQDVNTIFNYLESNSVLSDLCQVTLFFVLFVHLISQDEQFIQLYSATNFFLHTMSCLQHHMTERASRKTVFRNFSTVDRHGDLKCLAFKALRERKNKVIGSKGDICKEIDPMHYDLYISMGILVEEDVRYFTIENVVNPVQHRKEVKFSHKIFCEWFAAHYLSERIENDPGIDLEQYLSELRPVDVQYLYRFSCGLNPVCANKIIPYLVERERGEKISILCIWEHTGTIDNISEAIRQLCSEGVIVSAHDSQFLQRATSHLLEISATHNIPVTVLQLHNCFESVNLNFPQATLNTTSGLVLSSKIPVEQLGVRVYYQKMNDDKFNAILEFSSMIQSLRLLGFYGKPPPRSINLKSTLSNRSNSLCVKYYGSFSESPILKLNLQTGKWEKPGDGQQCTDEDFEQMESDWAEVGNKDEARFIRVMHEYRIRLSVAATARKGYKCSLTNEDVRVESGNDDTDIMASLRISRNYFRDVACSSELE